MKFVVRLDLTPLRDAACARIDAAWADRHARAEPLARLYAAKEALARAGLDGAPPHAALVAEAGHRGVEPRALCETIVAAAEAAREDILRREGERQAAKAAIRSAADQFAIDAVAGDFITRFRGV